MKQSEYKPSTKVKGAEMYSRQDKPTIHIMNENVHIFNNVTIKGFFTIKKKKITILFF